LIPGLRFEQHRVFDRLAPPASLNRSAVAKEYSPALAGLVDYFDRRRARDVDDFRCSHVVLFDQHILDCDLVAGFRDESLSIL
jgi:hypothetical protein